jgi:hypothetical protein
MLAESRSRRTSVETGIFSRMHSQIPPWVNIGLIICHRSLSKLEGDPAEKLAVRHLVSSKTVLTL